MSLSNKQEKLLQRYYDDECGIYSRFVAKHLIRKSTEAGAYLATLQHNSEALKTEVSNFENVLATDLWNKISARIEQEALVSSYSKHTAESSRSHFTNFIWGFSGAGVAVACGVVSFMLVRGPDYNNSNLSTRTQVAQNSISQVAPVVSNVALGKKKKFQKPIILEDEDLPIQMASTSTNSDRYYSRMLMMQRKMHKLPPLFHRKRAQFFRQDVAPSLH